MRIKLIAIAKGFDGDPLIQDSPRFTAYAKQGLYWQALTLIRRDKSAQEISCELPTLIAQKDLTYTPYHDWQAQLFVDSIDQHAKVRLTPDEYQVFCLLLHPNLRMIDIAKSLHLSRKTIYLRRKAIQAKLADLKPTLAA